jgi:hypothetical protein
MTLPVATSRVRLSQFIPYTAGQLIVNLHNMDSFDRLIGKIKKIGNANKTDSEGEINYK